jgi:DsbC/DsbD-like thiol-disulfide interchange protein
MRAPPKTILRSLLGLPVFLAILGFLRPDCAGAQSQSFPHGTVRLAAETSGVQAAHNFTLALHFSLEDGWHTYWVNPGDSGEPPRVAWTLPPGITAGPIEWPAPEKLGTSSVVDYGYQREVTLLVPMRVGANLPPEPSLTLSANVRVLVCKDVCIPGKTQVALTLPVSAQAPTLDPVERGLFTGARARLPHAPPAGWKLTAREDKDSFVLSAEIGKRIEQAYFYPIEESEIKNAARQAIAPSATGFALKLQKSDQLAKPVARLRGVLLMSGDRAYLVDAGVSSSGKGS